VTNTSSGSTTVPTGTVQFSGDATVSALDLTLATRSKGRKLGSGLSLG